MVEVLLSIPLRRQSGLYLNPDKTLFAAIVLYYLFSFLFINVFPINIVPLLVGVGFYLIHCALSNVRIGRLHLPSWLALTALSWLALLYLVVGLGLGVLLSMEFFFFFSLPLLYLAVLRLSGTGYLNYVERGCLAFLSLQLFVAAGQMLRHTTGYGFQLPAYYYENASEAYSTMITGTYLNANDLAATCGSIFVFSLLAKSGSAHVRKYTILLCFFLAILTASRFVLVFMVFSLAIHLLRVSVLRGIVSLIGLFSTLLVLLYFSQYFFSELEHVSRLFERINTIGLVFTQGISADNSMSVRLTSYLHFLSNIGGLGLGSVQLRDYTQFVSLPSERFTLFAINPHSFIVEVGYWLGWPGLTLLSLFMISVKTNHSWAFCYTLVAFAGLSMVSSSVINNFMFFLAFFSTISVIYTPVFNRINNEHHFPSPSPA